MGKCNGFGMIVLVAVVFFIGGLLIGNYAISEATPEDINQEVIAKLGKQVPLGDNPTIAEIINASALREQNPEMYAEASDGDYLVITPENAYLYDFKADVVKKIIPVQVRAPLPEDFYQKLTQHVQITAEPQVQQIENIAELKQAQPEIYANAKDGDFVVVFANTILVYDYAADQIVDSFTVSTAPPVPEDFVEKLSQHVDMTGEAQVSMIADPSVLLAQDEAFANAQQGHYLITDGSRVIVYDYVADTVIADKIMG